MPVLADALTILLVLLVCLFGAKWLLNAIGLQLPSKRGGIAAKATRRFTKGIWLFAGALFVIGLIATYVTPSVIGFIAAVGAAVQSSAQASAEGARAASGAAASAAPAIVGIVLGLAYWTGAGMWAAKARTKDGRMLRQVGAGALFLVLFVVFLQLFIV